MGVVAVVPARGGSRGLPGKNLARVGGESLVARAVRCGRDTQDIDEVVVSSDDDEILGEARRTGARTVRRPEALSSDEAPTRDVVLHALQDQPDETVVVVLQPTSPLRTPEDVTACLRALRGNRTTTTITELDHPVEWTMELTVTGRLAPLLGWEALARRRQAATRRYRLNGAVYACILEHLRTGGQLVDESTVGVVMPRIRAVDIDDQSDLLLARAWISPQAER